MPIDSAGKDIISKMLRQVLKVAGVNTMLAVAFLAIVFAGLETWLRYFTGPSNVLHSWAGNVTEDRVLGYRLRGSVSKQGALMEGDRLAYMVTYTTNESCWRVVPRPDTVTEEQFLAVFGGSFAYGMGVQDDETLSANLAQEFPLHQPYLFAVGGYGTANVYELIQHPELMAIEEPQGVGLYLLFTGHLDRVEGTLNTSRWVSNFPFYVYEDNQLQHRDNFAAAHPWKHCVYGTLNQSRLLRMLKADWPLVPAYARPDTVALTARLIAASAEQFKREYNDSPFYVVFYPRPDSPTLAAALTPHLDRLGVPYLTMHDLFDGLTYEERTVDRPGHPSPLANEMLAAEIARQLFPRMIGAPGFDSPMEAAAD